MNLQFAQNSAVPELTVSEELNRITDSSQTNLPQSRRKLLRYIVEETLAGRGSELTAVPIAQNVYDRDKFDHRTDPIVRIEARRLRRDLATYYDEAGRNNPVRITIPKGRYVARFEWSDQREPDRTEGISPKSFTIIPAWSASRLSLPPAVVSAVIILLLASVIAFVIWLRTDPQVSELRSGPTVMVLPFKAGIGSIEPAFSNGITYEVVTNLLRFPNIRVSATTEESRIATKLRDGGDDIYVLEGTIGTDDANVRIVARLVRLIDDSVIWSGSYVHSMTAQSLQDTEMKIANDIASRLGQMYGVINNDMLARSSEFAPRLESYGCILQTYHYRRNYPAHDQFQPVKACLEKTVEKDPSYAEAWAMLAFVYNDAVRFKRVSPDEVAETYSKAEQAANLAIALDPENASGWGALSAINHYQGNFEQSETYARRALENNLNDPETLAILAFRRITRGNLKEGMPLMERAIANNVNAPGWNHITIAIGNLVSGEYEAMLSAAQKSTIDESALSYSAVAMAYGMLGDRDNASRALQRMYEISPGYNPIERLKVHQFTNEIIELAQVALNKAGWTADKAESQ